MHTPPRPTCRFQRVTTPNNVCIIFLQPFEQFWCTLLGFVLTILPWAGITLISVAESGWRKPRGEPTGLYSVKRELWTYPLGHVQLCYFGLVFPIGFLTRWDYAGKSFRPAWSTEKTIFRFSRFCMGWFIAEISTLSESRGTGVLS